MSWARKRKTIYVSGILAVFFVVVVLPAIIYFYKAPTCSDGKMNQNELGVDCGGSCTLLCNSQYVPLNVLWSRFSKIDDGLYNVLAYVENPNINAGASNLDYVFKLYDKQGLLLKERRGRTFAPANKVMAIFETEIATGNLIPDRVEFSFATQAVWLKQDSVESALSVSQTIMSRVDTAPRLTFTLQNKTIKDIKQIEAIGIVYNADGNTVAFSKTIVDNLLGREIREVNLNWPKPFTEDFARTEIVLKVLK